MFEISVEWIDRRKRTKDYTVFCESKKELQAWLNENGNKLYSKAMIWISNKETHIGMEYSDIIRCGLL